MSDSRKYPTTIRSVMIALAAGVLLSGAGYLVLRYLQSLAHEADFQRAAENRVAAIKREIDSVTAAVRSMEALAAAGVEMSPASFRSVALQMLADRPRVRAIEWVPRVTAAGREGFERNVSVREGTHCRIWETTETEAQRAVGFRPEYFPVALVEPIETNRGTLCFDIAPAAPAEAGALAQARDSGQMSTLIPDRLVQDIQPTPALVLFAPVYSSGAATDSVTARRVALAGYVGGVIHVEDLVEVAMSYLAPTGLNVSVEDASTNRLLYSHATRLRSGQAAGSQPRLLSYTSDLPVPGGRLRVTCQSTPAFFESRRDSWIPLILCGLALLATLLGSANLYWLHNRTRNVEGLVGRRTAELYNANRQLEQEIDIRRQAQQSLTEAHRQAMESSRLKSQLLDNVSHQFRTPLHGIAGVTQLLLGTRLDPQQREYAEGIRDSADSLLRLINDILDVSRIESGKLSIRKSEFTLCDLVESALETVAPAAYQKNLALASYVPLRLPHVVSGDAARIRQVLLNLLSNAVKFTERGGVEVTVAEDPSANASGHVRLRFTVRDTGPGIRREHQAVLFQRFAQQDESGTGRRHGGGAGLSLPISRELAELMGGTIGVASEPDCGSVFWFTVQVERTAPEESEAEATLPPGHALVVPSEQFTRRVVERYLADWGWKVTVLPAQEDLARHLARAAYTVALVDRSYVGPLAGMGSTPVIRFERRAPATGGDVPEHVAELPGRSVILSKPVLRAQLHAALLAACRAAAKELDVHEAPLAESPRNGRQRPLSILLAEDNKVNQRVALRMIEKLGHQATVVETGRAAVEAAASGSFDLILMDCQMPEMDGYEAAMEIRRAEAGGTRIPIIALTAHAAEGARDRCFTAGMDDYVAKPLELADLARALESQTPEGGGGQRPGGA